MLSVNKDIFTSSFPNCILFFSLKHWLEPPIQCLIAVVRADVLAFVLILERKYLWFLLFMALATGLGSSLLFLFFLRVLLWMVVGFYLMHFLQLLRLSWVSSPSFCWYEVLYDYQMLSQPCIPGINCPLVMVDKFLYIW